MVHNPDKWSVERAEAEYKAALARPPKGIQPFPKPIKHPPGVPMELYVSTVPAVDRSGNPLPQVGQETPTQA